jgi:hypothetical protein
MTGPRILIVSYNWPPRNAIGTLRPYAWAKYWSEAGAQITVLTAVKHAFDAPLDLKWPAPAGVRVIEVSYGGTELTLLDRLMRYPTLRTYLRKLKALLIKSSLISSDPRFGWRRSARPYVQRLAKKHDVVISTYGPDACHLIGYDAKHANPDLIWVADYRDLWSQNHQHEWPENVRAQIRSLERDTVGRHANLITAVSEDMISRLGKLCRTKTFLAPNGFDFTDAELAQTLTSSPRRPTRPVRLVYTGTVYAGHRDPAPLLEALASMVDNGELKHGDVVVEFYGTRLDPITRLMDNSRLRPFLLIPGHVGREDAIQIQREADLLLLLESSAPEARGVLTGKIFEYISAGRPILCVGSKPDFEIGALLSRTGTGVVANTDDMVKIIKGFVDGNSAPEWFNPQIQEIARYSRKTQSLALLAEINKCRP